MEALVQSGLHCPQLGDICGKFGKFAMGGDEEGAVGVGVERVGVGGCVSLATNILDE